MCASLVPMTPSLFGRTRRADRGDPIQPSEPPTADALLRQLVLLADEERTIRRRRDRAILASRGGLRQRDVAQATGLSVARIKQIQQAGGASALRSPLRTPVTEVDLPASDAPPDSREDRTFLLADVAPWLEPIASERAFFAQDPSRGIGYDVHTDISDNGTDRWLVCMTTGTCEIYCFQAEGAAAAPPEPPRESWGVGSAFGPLYVLGRVMSRRLVQVAMNPQTSRIAQRPGGLAWVYGRILLLNCVLAALDRHPGTDGLSQYLETLPETELPDVLMD